MAERPDFTIAAIKAYIDEMLWRRREGAPLWRAMIVRVMRQAYAVVRDFSDGQLTLRAMSLVYTTLLSLVPLLAISFSILKGFGVHNQIEPFLQSALEPLGERSEEITRNIVEFVENIRVGVLGFVGFVLLFYTVVSLMQKIESAFNAVWEIPNRRSVGEQFRDYLSVVLVGPVLVFSSLGLTATIMGTPIMEQIASVQPFGWLIDVIGRLVPTAMVVGAFTFIYMFIPNTRVRVGPAFVGGLIAGVLWNTVGWLFAMFVAGAAKYTAVYSSFATPIVFMIWLYVGWMILLLGASIAFYQQHPEYLVGRRLAANLSVREKESLALAISCLIGERFYQQHPAFTADELAQRLEISPNIVQHVIGILERKGLTVASHDEPMRYLPARPWEETPVHAVLDAVRTDEEQASVGHPEIRPQPIIDHVLTDAETASRAALASMSLKDLAVRALEARSPAD
jgi:membrane protein